MIDSCYHRLIVVFTRCIYFFFFKQKTAYEMRISDWSSDVCSSDLHAAKLRASILPNRATPSSEIKGGVSADEGTNTTHYSVVDKQGNAVAVTYTINYLFGVGKIAGDTCFFLNTEMDDFTSKPGVTNSFGLVQGAANAVAPGKRPLTSMKTTTQLNN